MSHVFTGKLCNTSTEDGKCKTCYVLVCPEGNGDEGEEKTCDGTDGEGEFDHFYAAYERLVEKGIKGEMEESFTVIREMAPGLYEFQTFFIVSESAASKARIRAMENAMKESDAAKKHATVISEFVKEGFTTE